MNTQPDLHVIFGTGPMGTAVAKELLARGKHIRMVNRSGKLPRGLVGVEVVQGDAYSADTTREVTRGAAFVYQCAQPEYHQWVDNFPALQSSILEGAAANNARLVVVENFYMYGDIKGGILHEELPYNAQTRKGKVRMEMTKSLMAAHRAGKLKVVIGRGSDFFGPNDSVSGDLVYYPAIRGKRISALGNIDLPHTYTFTEDFAKALVILGESDDSYGQSWHVPNAPTVTTRQYLQLVGEAAGVPPKIGSANRLMLRMIGLFSPTVRETVEMMYEFEQPFQADHSKFVHRFGDTSTPLREAVQKTIDWCRQYPPTPH